MQFEYNAKSYHGNEKIALSFIARNRHDKPCDVLLEFPVLIRYITFNPFSLLRPSFWLDFLKIYIVFNI